MKNSKIEWTHHTFNPWIGCTKVSPACDNCYAAVSTPARTMKINWGAGQPRKLTSDANWREPLRWNADCAKRGVRERVFCASLADVFDNEMPASWRAELLELIAKTPHLDWLLLTKRIGNANTMLSEAMDIISHSLTEWGNPIWPNIWLGATICNQEEADRDIPKLLATPAAKRFLSIEPLLAAIDLDGMEQCDGYVDPLTYRSAEDMSRMHGEECESHERIDWVIVGGESGPNARPMHPDWARSLRDQCQAAGVPFFFKQWGEWVPGAIVEQLPQHKPREICRLTIEGRRGNSITEPAGKTVVRVGKKIAGRSLDGREWNQVPA